ncbi:hypothetical protein Scep_028642 [Stephania cephalantha]|uniref:Uncharacterized protein n=1 Tax=Stephania cephalantha TaxID=152367 RepID=A0AAP0EAC0_9MAGN
MASFISLLLLFNLFVHKLCYAADTINHNNVLRDGDTLVSNGGIFALGFFSPGNSKQRYVGIWYNKIPGQTVVWVANRDNPINNNSSSGVVKVDELGKLAIFNANSSPNPLWSANISATANTTSSTLSYKLLDTGNLVLRDENQGDFLWQSFDYPTDAFVPGMKLGFNKKTGLSWSLTSWKSPDDPSTGEFTLGMDLTGLPELVIKKASQKIWRPWAGEGFNGVPGMGPNPVVNFTMENVEHLEVVVNQPTCLCLSGFEPSDGSTADGSAGCVRKRELLCGEGDGFLKLENSKFPDTSNARVYMSLGIKDCEIKCRNNCSCTGYASAYVNGSGCLVWFGDLTDMREFTNGGQDFFVRVNAIEIGNSIVHSKGSFTKKKLVITLCVVIVVGLLIFISGFCYFFKKAKGRGILQRKRLQKQLLKPSLLETNEETNTKFELPIFDLNSMMVATENFSLTNELGAGGFGSVYKGTLCDGREIAVKRLSKNSGQGVIEFKNEVELIAKLQHRNLVQIIGCCIEEEEKMLIYEYMPNKSLDFLLFDQTKSMPLDWKMRSDIILGIARGVLYLHQDSTLTIIHRDLKASNILLDSNMNPKISDFGMARIFGSDQSQANTRRVVGTYGYMSPEYAMDGFFSIKSDVFSFGVILLEIISGKKNSGFYHEDPTMNLIKLAWELWKADTILELVDPSMGNPFPEQEVVRFIQVGILCVQENAKDRPTMSDVIFMLGNETPIPSLKQPAFVLTSNPNSANAFAGSASSVNEVSVTIIEGRYLFINQLCFATDTITQNIILRDGDTLVSDRRIFALGFFSPGNSKLRYVGIWYNKIPEQTVVWVANRNSPVYDSSSGVMKFDRRRNLAIFNGNAVDPVWSTNITIPIGGTSTVCKLLDSGNLVLLQQNKGGLILWQSFDHPTNTLLPGMKVRLSFKSGLNWSFTSWKSRDDPSIGGLRVESPRNKDSFRDGLGSKLLEDGAMTGLLQQIFATIMESVDPLGAGDGFLKLEKIKLPDTSNARVDMSLGIKDCEIACRNNCSCTGYACPYVNRSGCLVWFGDLVDIREYTDGGQDFFVRVDAIELGLLRKERLRKQLPIFDLNSILVATENFSVANKLGAGGFGSVYKGKLSNGREIAVKRLSKNSGQGVIEFKTEVELIAKLQHRNLVQIIGCCTEEEEKIGYMSPEYAMDGLFSIKSDVFSFGVLLLEIISSKKNSSFFHEDPSMNLIKHTWELWKEGRILELVDPAMSNSFPKEVVLRFIQVGILCVQEKAKDRPTMSDVIFMLRNETPIPPLKQPAFVLTSNSNSANASAGPDPSLNEMTTTTVRGR